MLTFDARRFTDRCIGLIVAASISIVCWQRIANADESAKEAIQAAASAGHELLRSLDARLAREKARLAGLVQLRSRGQATWREVAEQQVVVASLAAERKGADEHSAFVAKFSKRAEGAEPDQAERSMSCFYHGPTLQVATRNLLEAKVRAVGELRVAEVALKRQRIQLTALEQLFAKGCASERELAQARDNVRDADLLVERLASERLSRIKSFEIPSQLPASAGADCCGAPNETLDIRPDALPPSLLANPASVQGLLELRGGRGTATAASEAIAAQLEFVKALLDRLTKAKIRSAGAEREIEHVRLDVEHSQALQLAAQERMQLLRLKEQQFVAMCLEQGSVEPLGQESIPWLISAQPQRTVTDRSLPNHCGRRRPYSTHDANALTERELSGWTMQGKVTRGVFGSATAADIGLREPAYSDYYEFGIRRTDLPPRIRSGFAPGGIPWYLPGSPTNFK